MKPLNRLKKQKRPFTTEHFYIYQSPNQWQFRDRNTHKVVSTAHSLDRLSTCISNVFKRYKHYDGYLLAVKKAEGFSLPIPPKEMEYRIEQHRLQGHIYDYVIEDILNTLQNNSKDVDSQPLSRALPVKPAVEEKAVTKVIQPKRVLKKRSTRL